MTCRHGRPGSTVLTVQVVCPNLSGRRALARATAHIGKQMGKKTTRDKDTKGRKEGRQKEGRRGVEGSKSNEVERREDRRKE